MAKTAPNKKAAPVSIHSRAAKRASSPGIDLDKSLKDVKPPTDSKNQRPSVLAVHQGAGVTKKSKHGRKSVMSARARRRHEKGLDRAESVMDKTEMKVEKSKGRARTVQERSKAWEELNKKILAKNAAEEAARIEKENMTDEDEVESMEDVDVQGGAEQKDLPMEAVAQQTPLPDVGDDDDEIL
ncbi:Uncharacterized protein BP5553_03759 [Venustampulla echinocandica]|uniref:Alb1-domain-containing protein n=1 Tax=Venustampulla echinocandica TaxID=2656787 RepID=A0A370TV86_9HELO|nr:Uncharacterized protein BP5553_03759 [Venustampulla echinocandica]RDL39419.1 Uncharacterized protein BP5553_03759 [Venustampulla echinocandica]